MARIARNLELLRLEKFETGEQARSCAWEKSFAAYADAFREPEAVFPGCRFGLADLVWDEAFVSIFRECLQLGVLLRIAKVQVLLGFKDKFMYFIIYI